MTYQIKKAISSDAPILTQIAFAAKRHWNYPETWIQMWKDDLTITEELFKNNVVFKICEANQILGFCTLEEENGAYEVGHFWVRPEKIGKGLGRQLMEELLAHCAQEKIESLKVIADPNAASFYEHFGFQHIGTLESVPKGRILPLLKLVR